MEYIRCLRKYRKKWNWIVLLNFDSQNNYISERLLYFDNISNNSLEISLKIMFHSILKHFYMEITILLKYLKIYLDIDLKIILLDYQNNYVQNSSVMNNMNYNKFWYSSKQLKRPTWLFWWFNKIILICI